jgi:hypothetical protein
MLEWVIFAKEWSGEKLKASDKMPMEFYGSTTASWFRRTLNFIVRSWTRPIAHGILFIQEPTRCMKI